MASVNFLHGFRASGEGFGVGVIWLANPRSESLTRALYMDL